MLGEREVQMTDKFSLPYTQVTVLGPDQCLDPELYAGIRIRIIVGTRIRRIVWTRILIIVGTRIRIIVGLGPGSLLDTDPDHC